ncbi:MAG: ABC transporter permease [Lachnospiraceae bacterium]
MATKKDKMLTPASVLANRKLIMRLGINDFKTKFAGSYLGIIWAFVQPVITVLVYWFVFEKGLKINSGDTSDIGAPFVLWLLGGLVPWFFFSDALNGGTRALLDYSYLVKKVVFNIDILPIVKVLSAFFVHLFFIAFTIVLFFAYRYYPDLYTLQIFYYTFCLFLLVTGMAYFTSAIVVFFRDLNQIINIILQVGVWVTPIMWNLDGMGQSSMVVYILKLNPLYYIVLGYRDSLINKVGFWEHPGQTAYFWIFTIIMLLLGNYVFSKLRTHFADVL